MWEVERRTAWRCWYHEPQNCCSQWRAGTSALSPAQPWRCISVGHGAGEEQQGELSLCWSVSEDHGSTGGHSCPPAPCWGSITCIYCHRVCPYWCRLGDVLGPLVIPQLRGRHKSRERERPREKWFGKNVSRKPQGPTGEECQSQVPPRCAEQIALGSNSRQRFLFSGSRLALSDKRVLCYCILPRRYGSVHPVLLSSSSKYTQE